MAKKQKPKYVTGFLNNKFAFWMQKLIFFFRYKHNGEDWQ